MLETTSVASASEAFHTSSAMPVQGERRKRGNVIVADLDRDRLFQGALSASADSLTCGGRE